MKKLEKGGLVLGLSWHLSFSFDRTSFYPICNKFISRLHIYQFFMFNLAFQASRVSTFRETINYFIVMSYQQVENREFLLLLLSLLRSVQRRGIKAINVMNRAQLGNGWGAMMNFLMKLMWRVAENTIWIWRPEAIELWYTGEILIPLLLSLSRTHQDIVDTMCHCCSGDHDLSIPCVGTQEWIRSLNFSIVDDWRSWIVDGQVAG